MSIKFKFREEMAEKGVHILLSLPNGTAATAEMDQLYSKFKPRCSESTIRVGGLKMAKRAAARKKREAAKRRKEDSGEADDVDNDDVASTCCPPSAPMLNGTKYSKALVASPPPTPLPPPLLFPKLPPLPLPKLQIVLLFLLLAGLAYTATEAFQSFFGIFSAVLGAIPLVLRIFSFTRSGSLE